MNELAFVTQFIIDEFKLNILVNTITFEKSSDIDLNKENIYPLVNIDIIESTYGDQVLTFNYIITILQQRDTEPKLTDNKIFGSNLIDNLNECNSIAVKFLTSVRNTNDTNIDFIEISVIEMIKYEYGNLLDGVKFTLTAEYPNLTPCN